IERREERQSKADKKKKWEKEALQELAPVDTRKKKADKSRDKEKRAFGVSESFILEENEAELNAKKRKEAKKKAKLEQRKKPTPIFLPQFINISQLANQLKVP